MSGLVDLLRANFREDQERESRIELERMKKDIELKKNEKRLEEEAKIKCEQVNLIKSQIKESVLLGNQLEIQQAVNLIINNIYDHNFIESLNEELLIKIFRRILSIILRELQKPKGVIRVEYHQLGELSYEDFIYDLTDGGKIFHRELVSLDEWNLMMHNVSGYFISSQCIYKLGKLQKWKNQVKPITMTNRARAKKAREIIKKILSELPIEEKEAFKEGNTGICGLKNLVKNKISKKESYDYFSGYYDFDNRWNEVRFLLKK